MIKRGSYDLRLVGVYNRDRFKKKPDSSSSSLAWGGLRSQITGENKLKKTTKNHAQKPNHPHRKTLHKKQPPSDTPPRHKNTDFPQPPHPLFPKPNTTTTTTPNSNNPQNLKQKNPTSQTPQPTHPPPPSKTLQKPNNTPNPHKTKQLPPPPTPPKEN